MSGPRHTETIEDVLEALQETIDDSAADESRVGYFAALYRQVTVGIARAIDAGAFDDGERMSRLGAAFGNRYLEALHAWRSAGRPNRSWRTSFRAADDARPVVVQHLALGVNAHVNLDLPISAARLCPGDAIAGLKRDFDLINGILVTVLSELQARLAGLSPLLGALDVVLGRLDEEIVGFNVRKARSEAWEAAVLLAHQPADAQDATEKMLDRYANGLARVVLAPPFPLPAALDVLRSTELSGVAATIRMLGGQPGVTGG